MKTRQQELSCQESNAVLDLFPTSSSLCQPSLLLAHWRPFKVVVVVVVVFVVVVVVVVIVDL